MRSMIISLMLSFLAFPVLAVSQNSFRSGTEIVDDKITEVIAQHIALSIRWFARYDEISEDQPNGHRFDRLLGNPTVIHVVRDQNDAVTELEVETPASYFYGVYDYEEAQGYPERPVDIECKTLLRADSGSFRAIRTRCSSKANTSWEHNSEY